MARKFKKLKEKMSSENLRQANQKAQEMMAEMLLSELRKSSGYTQRDLAAALGIKQPSLSKLESQEDMQITTLQRLIAAMGGELEIIAHMPYGDVRVKQFNETESSIERPSSPPQS